MPGCGQPRLPSRHSTVYDRPDGNVAGRNTCSRDEVLLALSTRAATSGLRSVPDRGGRRSRRLDRPLALALHVIAAAGVVGILLAVGLEDDLKPGGDDLGVGHVRLGAAQAGVGPVHGPDADDADLVDRDVQPLGQVLL